MTESLFHRVLVPVASPDDAAATGRAVSQYLGGEGGVALVTNVIEKAGGAPDKASVEQREEYAADAFGAFREAVGEDVEVETLLTYGTDVAETLVETAHEEGASAIVFTPRGGSRWLKLLTGDVATELVEISDVPVVVLPESEDNDG